MLRCNVRDRVMRNTWYAQRFEPIFSPGRFREYARPRRDSCISPLCTRDAAHDADPPISQLRVNEVLSITRAQFRTASGWYKVNKLIHRLTTIQFLSYQAGPPQHHLLIVPDNDKAHPCLVQQDN